MLRRSLYALTVVTFAACTDDQGRQDALNDADANPTDLHETPAPDPTPSETRDAEAGVGPGLIILETNPAAEAIPAEPESPTPGTQPGG